MSRKYLFTKELEVKFDLTEEEKENVQKSLLEVLQAIPQEENAFHSLKISHKAKIQQLTQKVERSAAVLRDGFEYRTDDCKVFLDFDLQQRLVFSSQGDMEIKINTDDDGKLSIKKRKKANTGKISAGKRISAAVGEELA